MALAYRVSTTPKCAEETTISRGRVLKVCALRRPEASDRHLFSVDCSPINERNGAHTVNVDAEQETPSYRLREYWGKIRTPNSLKNVTHVG